MQRITCFTHRCVLHGSFERLADDTGLVWLTYGLSLTRNWSRWVNALGWRRLLSLVEVQVALAVRPEPDWNDSVVLGINSTKPVDE